MLRLAYKNGKLTRLPFVEKLAEAPPRAGFVTREQFDTIRKRLPEELRAAMTVAYTFGWRKREVLDLKKHQYNSHDGTLRLDPGTTKNGEGRVIKVLSSSGRRKASVGGTSESGRYVAHRPFVLPTRRIRSSSDLRNVATASCEWRRRWRGR